MVDHLKQVDMIVTIGYNIYKIVMRYIAFSAEMFAITPPNEFRRWKKVHGEDGAIMKQINSQCNKISVIF